MNSMRLTATFAFFTALVCWSMAACKQPVTSDLSEYKGSTKEFAASIENGQVKFAIGDIPAKAHNVLLKIDETIVFGAQGVTIPPSKIKVPGGKLEITTTSNGTESAEICFLAADSTLAGGNVKCANFRDACVGDTDADSYDKDLYGGEFIAANNGTCRCVSGEAGTETQVTYKDFLARNEPGLLCKEIRKKALKIDLPLIESFASSCSKLGGTFNPGANLTNASCACPAGSGQEDAISLTSLVSTDKASAADVSSGLTKACENKETATGEVCKELDVLVKKSDPNKAFELRKSADTFSCQCVVVEARKDIDLKVFLEDVRTAGSDRATYLSDQAAACAKLDVSPVEGESDKTPAEESEPKPPATGSEDTETDSKEG